MVLVLAFVWKPAFFGNVDSGGERRQNDAIFKKIIIIFKVVFGKSLKKQR
jgi:hypothetical protein